MAQSRFFYNLTLKLEFNDFFLDLWGKGEDQGHLEAAQEKAPQLANPSSQECPGGGANK